MEAVNEGATVWIFAPPTWVVADGGKYSGVLALHFGAMGVYSARDQTFLATTRLEAAEDAKQRVAAAAIDHILAHDFSMAWSEVYFTKTLIYLASSHATNPDEPFDMEACARAHAALWGMSDNTTPMGLCGYGPSGRLSGKFLKATRAWDADVPEKLQKIVRAKAQSVTLQDEDRKAAKRPLLLSRP